LQPRPVPASSATPIPFNPYATEPLTPELISWASQLVYEHVSLHAPGYLPHHFLDWMIALATEKLAKDGATAISRPFLAWLEEKAEERVQQRWKRGVLDRRASSVPVVRPQPGGVGSTLPLILSLPGGDGPTLPLILPQLGGKGPTLPLVVLPQPVEDGNA
jgi:hypothetical protein